MWVLVLVCACAAASFHCLRAVIDLCLDISLADVISKLMCLCAYGEGTMCLCAIVHGFFPSCELGVDTAIVALD